MILDKVKVALRISSDTTAFDVEIQDLVNAAIADLSLTGIKVLDTSDPLIIQAVITYAKAHFGWDNPERDKFLLSYNMLKMHLSLAGEYNVIP